MVAAGPLGAGAPAVEGDVATVCSVLATGGAVAGTAGAALTTGFGGGKFALVGACLFELQPTIMARLAAATEETTYLRIRVFIIFFSIF
jgi:hypothetical protein